MPTDLDAMLQRLASQVAVDESRAGTNAFERIPQEQVAAAVRPIQSDNFALFDAEIVRKPVANPLDSEIESLVRPQLTFKVQEKMVGYVLLGPVFKVMVHQHPVLRPLLDSELHGFRSGITAATCSKIVSNVKLCVQICCCGCNARQGGDHWDCNEMSASNMIE